MEHDALQALRYDLPVSVLSVEPWLVEPLWGRFALGVYVVSVLSVEPWLVELNVLMPSINAFSFSALSRAVVGGTTPPSPHRLLRLRFSALSRAVVGGTTHHHAIASPMQRVSVLSVEPWLVEPNVQCRRRMTHPAVSVLSVEPWLVERIRWGHG